MPGSSITKFRVMSVVITSTFRWWSRRRRVPIVTGSTVMHILVSTHRKNTRAGKRTTRWSFDCGEKGKHIVVTKRRNKPRHVDDDVMVWLAPKAPSIYATLLAGTYTMDQCSECIEAAQIALQKKLGPITMAELRTTEEKQRQLLWTKQAILNGQNVDDPDSREIEHYNKGATVVNPMVTCFVCVYCLPINSATHLPELPSKQMFGGPDAPINPTEGFYFCKECLGACDYCGESAVISSPNTLCTSCWRAHVEHKKTKRRKKIKGSRIMETSEMFI